VTILAPPGAITYAGTASGWQTVGVDPVAAVKAVGPGGQRGRYGIDGGYAGLAVFGLTEAGLAGTVAWAARRRRLAVAALAAVGGAAVAGSAASYLYSTGPGKRAVWAQLLDELGLRGDEHVLDVGCGRGAVLMLAARRVPAGRAVGVDVWRRRDQSGNSHAATERNAVAEGVHDQVELADADARDLPFASESFDVVLSSLAISNIRDADGRAQALREAVRVLRPGGQLRIVDDGADRYAAVLQEAGCTGVAVRQLGWRTWYGLPGHHIPLVVAARPATPGSDLEKNAPPRLDPLARALKLTFQGAHEEITVDLEIGTI
jgi:arsenite methyltransferase